MKTYETLMMVVECGVGGTLMPFSYTGANKGGQDSYYVHRAACQFMAKPGKKNSFVFFLAAGDAGDEWLEFASFSSSPNCIRHNAQSFGERVAYLLRS